MKTFFSLLVALTCISQAYCNAPSPIVTAGDFAFVSGQFPIDPVSGTIVVADIGTLTQLTISNIQHLLREKGFDLKKVVNAVVYLTDMRDYDAMLAAFLEEFDFTFPPALEVVAVSELPLKSRIEIACTAYLERQ